MKIGIRGKIDVTKIDKNRLFKGSKGTYLDFTTFVNLDEQDEYGQNGFVSQDVTKEEKESGVKGAILGNVNVFWTDDQPTQQREPAKQQIPDSDQIPF